MFGKLRQVTGIGDVVTQNVNGVYERWQSAIGFNFEGVGQYVKGKTAAIKLHKIRYTPRVFPADDGTFPDYSRNPSWQITCGLTPLDTPFPIETGNVQAALARRFFDNQSVFGIHNWSDQVWGWYNTGVTGPAPSVFSWETAEVDLGVMLPYDNINASMYAEVRQNFGSGGAETYNVSATLCAELFYSYELLTPVEFQQLKNDWQGRIGSQGTFGLFSGQA